GRAGADLDRRGCQSTQAGRRPGWHGSCDGAHPRAFEAAGGKSGATGADPGATSLADVARLVAFHVDGCIDINIVGTTRRTDGAVDRRPARQPAPAVGALAHIIILD